MCVCVCARVRARVCVGVLSSFCIRFLCAILFAAKFLDKCSELSENGRQTYNEKEKDNVVS